ncbi:hypothetical protein [Ruminococcus sp.]|uniref:hypothetical protein n=1 Tax=Ruminococcus sp. TaxID=41978 RepID=UPI0025E9D343|nr:hypothetical protein [Ruminococcus sp.]
MTIDEAIAILRQHNTTGASVMQITGGRALEQELLAQVLDRCEQNEAELKEAKRLLKLALQDLAEADHCGLCKHEPDDIATCQRKPINCFVWRYADEALKLIGGAKDET